MSRYLAHSISELNLNPKEYSLKIVYDFKLKSKAHTISNKPFSERLLKNIMLDLFSKADIYRYSKIIRIGMSCKRFYDKKIFDIFTYENDSKNSKLSLQTEKIRKKYGVDILKWGVEFGW